MQALETVRVKCPVCEGNDQGFYNINKEDFDAEKHELFEESVVPTIDAACAEIVLRKTEQEEPAVKPAWVS